jgi:spermidine/putrescine ABC transporter ATP-binding subunit
MRAAEVGLDKVGKRYGDLPVLCDVSLQIRGGEFYTFLGPSGCGKTTLLRIIAGFVAPDRGTVYLDGESVNQVPPWRRNVGMVFQNYALWPHLTVFENVAFGLRERKVPRGEIDRRVAEALDRVELTGTEKRRPSQLSGGQQQRVALARTLVIEPRVLLLDEPLSNLDAKLRVEMRLELLKLQRDLGLTTIYVTHDQEEALAMSTRIAILNKGRVIQQGRPREIYEEPINDFVAGFVGQTNLFSGKIARCLDGLVEVDVGDGLILKAARPSSAAISAGDEVSVTIRPEAVGLNRFDTAPDERNQVAGIVSASVYQGSVIEYEVLAGRTAIKARVMNPRGTPLLETGAPVSVDISPRNVLVVPARRG